MSDSNVSSFLKKVSNLKKNTIDVYIPSKKKTFTFNSLTLKQQKDIITCVADGVAGLISFTRTLNSIIETSNDETFKIYDRVPIVLALRANALGSKYKKEDKEIDLDAVLEKFKNLKPLKDSGVFTFNDIKVEVEVPSLQDENIINKKLEDELRRNKENNTKNLGSIYVYEIAKHIKSVSYDELVLDFSTLKVSERIEVIEALPLALNKQIVSFIEEFRRQEREALTIDDVTVDIEPGFFDVE